MVIAFTSDFIPRVDYLIRNAASFDGFHAASLCTLNITDLAYLNVTALPAQLNNTSTCVFSNNWKLLDQHFWELMVARLLFVILFEVGAIFN